MPAPPTTSKNPKVQSFLEDLMMYNNNWFAIVLEIRKIILESNNQIQEKIMHGGIMFTIENINVRA